MKVLLPTLGSAGDVHPFLAIGRSMQERGHEVEILTNPVFAEMVEQAGLQFYPVGTREHYADALKSPKLWHPIDGFGVFWRRMACHAIEPVYKHIAQHTPHEANSRCVVLATPLMIGARLANEKLKVPLVTAYTAATMLRSCENPLTMAHWRIPNWVPRTARAAAWRALDKWKLNPMVAEDLLMFRKQLGLPAINQSVFGQWVHSPQAGVTLFPPWFAPAPSDWPRQVEQAGFPIYDDNATQGLDAELSRFVDAGDAPVVFTPGSAMGHGHAFFRAAVRTCMELGRRGVLLTTDVRQIPCDLPPTVHYCAYAPFRLLLPRASALVHHGGIGNSAQALRAALPQLLTPMGFDQFDNAMRLERLGVAATVARSDTDFASMTPLLRGLLNSASVELACQQAAETVRKDQALNTICDVLEAAL